MTHQHPEPAMLTQLRERLERRHTEQLWRIRRRLEGPQGIHVQIDGEALLSFCSNDYLGLAADPRVGRALAAAVDQYGVGSGASHLVTGHSEAHHVLEEELATFVGAERALLFSTGYMANLALAGTLLERQGTVFEDKLNHASLIDAARLSGAAIKRFRHGDLDRLAQLLSGVHGDKLILTDGVFSMDGDLANLPRLLALARDHEAWLLIDDAHGLGVLGDHGCGSFEHWQQPLAAPAILLGTLGKAFGTFGAFIAGNAEVIETLIQQARPYIYTTALPPALAEATRVSLQIVQQEGWRRSALRERIAQFRAGMAALGYSLPDSETPIQPVVLGTADAALAASDALRARGILVPAIRPPTVPAGTSRLRISLSATHDAEHIEQLLAAMAAIRA